jgi:hypothetical protein
LNDVELGILLALKPVEKDQRQEDMRGERRKKRYLWFWQ